MSERYRWKQGEPLQRGAVFKYDYCRGVGHEGYGVLRGRDGWEWWIKTLEGTNHFGKRNFVVTTDVKMWEITEEEFDRVERK